MPIQKDDIRCWSCDDIVIPDDNYRCPMCAADLYDDYKEYAHDNNVYIDHEYSEER